MGALTKIDAGDFSLYNQYADTLATNFMSQYARERGADAYSKAQGEASTRAQVATAAAQQGVTAQLASMGVDPSSPRYQSLLQKGTIDAAKLGVSAFLGANQQQDQRAMAAASAASGAVQNAAKLKGDVWLLQNQQEQIGNQREVGMANAAANMVGSQASADRVALDRWKYPYEYDLNKEELGIKWMDSTNSWMRTSHDIDDETVYTPPNTASTAALMGITGWGKGTITKPAPVETATTKPVVDGSVFPTI